VSVASFGWRYLDAAGADVGSSESFGGRDAAEAWLAEAWVDLSGRGVEEVVLVDRGTGESLYRMSLGPA
jgi:hypothetical protein